MEMHKLAWQIIDGFCRGVGAVAIICIIFGDITYKTAAIIGGIAVVGIICALICGKVFFPY